MRAVGLAAGGLLAAMMLAGCGGSGTGGGKMDIRELEDTGEQYDSVFEEGPGAEDAAVEEYRNGGDGAISDGVASAECEVGYRSCCDEGEIYTLIEGFTEPMCAIVSTPGS